MLRVGGAARLAVARRHAPLRSGLASAGAPARYMRV
eukprot:COSAG02_NODE_68269_length_251_cov_0.638158_1_plen_35_part_01